MARNYQYHRARLIEESESEIDAQATPGDNGDG
jgi:hypothetical protein